MPWTQLDTAAVEALGRLLAGAGAFLIGWATLLRSLPRKKSSFVSFPYSRADSQSRWAVLLAVFRNLLRLATLLTFKKKLSKSGYSGQVIDGAASLFKKSLDVDIRDSRQLFGLSCA
jgi:hypothetical protein